MVRKRIWLVILLMALIIIVVVYIQVSKNQTPANPKWAVAPQNNQKYTVIAIGGSTAYGWVDAKGEGGYLARAFRTVNSSSNIQSNMQYSFINESKEGYGPLQYDTGKFANLFTQYKPNMIVISFGMLDDVYKKTPISKIKKSLHDEINVALQNHAVVVMVTPPPTYASETYYKSQADAYVQAGTDVAKSFHNPNVYVLPLGASFDQYLKTHNQSIKMYEADSWHPNAAGHALAGQILAQEIISTFLNQK